MKTVWKFELPVQDEFALVLPLHAEVLHVGAQREKPYAWVLLDPEAPTRQRHFHLRGTGHEATGMGRHVGTYMLHGGEFVGHVFERASA